jgi:DNA-3-methyladenine glycosylase
VDVARDLLGHVVLHRVDGVSLAGRIVETEAYLGGSDEASHSFAGLTERTRVIFGPAGHAYVYLIYGMHHCLNFIAERAGVPGCVLIRALEPLVGIEAMRSRRSNVRSDTELANGPGKLTKAMGIDGRQYGADLTRGALTVRETWDDATPEIEVTPRIGISKAKDLPLRFLIAHNRCVSKR